VVDIERVPRKSGQSERSMERDESDGYGPLSDAEDASPTPSRTCILYPISVMRRVTAARVLLSVPRAKPLRARFTHSSTCSPVGVTYSCTCVFVCPHARTRMGKASTAQYTAFPRAGGAPQPAPAPAPLLDPPRR
jgi:hypothetical protein